MNGGCLFLASYSGMVIPYVSHHPKMMAVDALAALSAWEAHHHRGDDALKACLWNITKARHHQGVVSACDVRPERWVASWRLQDDDNAVWGLVETPRGTSGPVEFTIPSHTTTTTSTLRHRKPQNNSQQKMENKNDDHAAGDHDDSHKGLHEDIAASMEPTEAMTDILELWGGVVAPRDLKAAQTHARQALEHYVHAANRVRAILTAIQEPPPATEKDGDDDNDSLVVENSEGAQ